MNRWLSLGGTTTQFSRHPNQRYRRRATKLIPIAGACITVPSCERSVTAIGALVFPAQAAVMASTSPKPVSNPAVSDTTTEILGAIYD
jgi:hypothetical protein